jgi:hypothetical protein
MDGMLLWALLLLGCALALAPKSVTARFVGHMVLVLTVLDYTGIELLSFVKACALAVCILCSFSLCLQFM